MEESDDENWVYCKDCDSYDESICKFCNRPEYKLTKSNKNRDEDKLVDICYLTCKYLQNKDLDGAKNIFIKEMKENNFDLLGTEVVILESSSLDELCNIITNYHLMPEKVKNLHNQGYKLFINNF